jgi:hypothetical protein
MSGIATSGYVLDYDRSKIDFNFLWDSIDELQLHHRLAMGRG